jgi:ABC-2 type transport system permease protein
MSTATAPLDAPLTPPSRARDHRPGFVRLTHVELRKMVDTRAGFWLLTSVLAITVLTVVLTVVQGDAESHTLRNVLENSLQPLAILLPIVGILLITSEWSQRTALITFALVPVRGRVLVAKIVASLALTAIALVAAIALSALGTALAAPGVDDTWSLGGGMLGQMVLYIVTSMLMGVAYGTILLSSAPAIVLSFVVPIAVAAVTNIVHALDGLGRWIDQSRTLSDLVLHDYSGKEWARAGVTLLVWMVVPLLVGAYRFTRGEVR